MWQASQQKAQEKKEGGEKDAYHAMIT